MELRDEKIVKSLFTASLVVALVNIKSGVEHITKGEPVFFNFIIFLISLFILSLIEFIFEKIDELKWFKRLFDRNNFIQGWWLNYSVDRDTKEIFNFALIKIDCSEKIKVFGHTFKVCFQKENATVLSDGYFFSTISQYQDGLLGFNFTIDNSEKVLATKHKIFGSAEYVFDPSDGIPCSFTGEFSAETPHIYCTVMGHRIDDKIIKESDALEKRFHSVLLYSIDNKLINGEMIKQCP